MFWPRYQKLTLTTPDGARIFGLVLGDGPIPLLLIPGAGDGMATADEAAWRLAMYLRPREHTYRITYLSRRQPIPEGFSVEQLADDYLWAVEQLGWGPGIVECNSGGGPIGQWLAAKRPDLVRGLVLSCTLHRTNEHTAYILGLWKGQAERHEWRELNWSSIQHTFRPQTVAKFKPWRFLLGLSKPRYPERLARVFDGLLGMDNRAILPRIACPTLVIGGRDDQVIPADLQREMAALIPNSELKLYPGFGHGNDQENPEYNRELERFAREAMSRVHA